MDLPETTSHRTKTRGVDGRTDGPHPDLINQISQFNDLDTILEKVLFEARMMAGADAGSVYIIHGNRLKFSAVQNNSLFPAAETDIRLEQFMDTSLPLTKDSIVGCSILTDRILAADDAYRLPPDFPCAFDATHDRRSGYRTKSILTIPLKIFENRVVGAIQLINAKNRRGEVIAFSAKNKARVPVFIRGVAGAIEKGMIYRGWILRALKMAELRDPFETGMHAQRVGIYSASIYKQWARKRGICGNEIQHTADLIRLAAMQHDVGKLGIPDAILKKPGKLTRDEYAEMKWHTIYGYRLFADNMTDLDQMSAEIALNHHEKWNGGGYPGSAGGALIEEPMSGKSKKGMEIPLSARITALADTFDTLSSERCYKPAWKDADIRDEIRKNTGTDFDPEVVAAFFDILEDIKKIRCRYREADQ
ncbi:MAG: HD domain-containing protein [Desulfobacteraceae bacterium]|nr:HD domain-containing protein [Desulfobacteraceae bacterium]